jgi:hypothetical protein
VRPRLRVTGHGVHTDLVTDDQPHAPPASTSPSPPTRRERVLTAATVAAKVVTLACAVDAFVNASSPRLRGKAIRTRAIGYTAALFIVPLVWRLNPDRGRYPSELDLAVTTPLLLDAAGNALGLYEEAHIDDIVHFANAAIVSGVAGAVFSPHVDEPWQAALAGAGVAIAGETAWELMEYGAWRLGADGLDLTYEDSMDDIAESWFGAALGALVTLTRMPRSKPARTKGGWQAPLGLRPREGG